MNRRTVRLKAGMRVRVRQTASSPIAGYEGIVTYVGDSVCDVKVVRRRGSKIEESIMDTLPKTELESVYQNVDLVSMDTLYMGSGWRRWTFWIVGAVVAVTAAWAFVYWVIGG